MLLDFYENQRFYRPHKAWQTAELSIKFHAKSIGAGPREEFMDINPLFSPNFQLACTPSLNPGRFTKTIEQPSKNSTCDNRMRPLWLKSSFLSKVADHNGMFYHDKCLLGYCIVNKRVDNSLLRGEYSPFSSRFAFSLSIFTNWARLYHGIWCGM